MDSTPLRRADMVCKLVIIGDTGVGKTSVMRRFTDDEFSYNFVATIGKFLLLMRALSCYFLFYFESVSKRVHINSICLNHDHFKLLWGACIFHFYPVRFCNAWSKKQSGLHIFDICLSSSILGHFLWNYPKTTTMYADRRPKQITRRVMAGVH